MCVKSFLILNLAIFIIITHLGLSNQEGAYTFKNLIQFPYSNLQGPFMGLFLALSLPLELPNYNVFFSYNFEANYNLPQNQSEFTYPPLITDSASERSWDRKFFYDILEFKMKSHGHPGRACLLRTICEASLHSSENTGILGDILHIILTPSSSVNTNIISDYEKAEKYGQTKKNCRKYAKKCSISFLGLISRIERYFEHIE